MDALKKQGKSLLFFSVEAGSGHRRAAQALKGALESRGDGWTGIVDDAYTHCPPWVYQGIIGTYLKMIDRAPALYSFLFSQAESPAKAKLGKGLNSALMIKTGGDRLVQRIAEVAPAAIVCTHPFPLGALVALRKQGRFDVPLYGVVTDFTVHPFWVYPEADGFFVAHQAMVQEFADLGVDPSKCHPTGIPVDEAFSCSFDREEILRSLGLSPERRTLLVMGGSLGLGPVIQLVRELGARSGDFQLIVVAGHNQKLQQTLAVEAEKARIPIKVLGFVENVHELMAASDLLLTKPGGLSVYEALVMGLPLLLLDPLPGQEERNVEILTQLGVARQAGPLEGIPQVTKELLSHREILQEMAQKAIALGRGDSSRQAVERILAGGGGR